MINLHLDRIVTVSKELGNGITSMSDYRYKDLEKVLHSHSEITVRYPFGKREKRCKQLQKLGYNFKETIYYNDEAVHSPIKEVWSRYNINKLIFIKLYTTNGK